MADARAPSVVVGCLRQMLSVVADLISAASCASDLENIPQNENASGKVIQLQAKLVAGCTRFRLPFLILSK